MAKKGGRSSKAGKAGKASGGWRDSMGPAAIIIGVIVVFGGLAVANQMGVFEGADPCSAIKGGEVLHDHARLFVFLDSDRPYDFSPSRYQVQASFVHFENGPRDAQGADIHLHQSGVTLKCLLQTLNWSVDSDGITLDTGEHYPIDDQHELVVMMNGEELSEGLKTEIHGCDDPCNRYEVRYRTIGSTDGSADGADTGTGSDGNQTGNSTLARD